jgi:hypothetical protein
MDPQFMEKVVGVLFPGAVNEEEGRTNEERELQLPGEELWDTAGARNRRLLRMSWPGLS